MAEDKNETDKKDEQQAAAANVLPAELSKEMRTSFLEYSMSVIVSRALPDVRDGLKPGFTAAFCMRGMKAASPQSAPMLSPPVPLVT